MKTLGSIVALFFSGMVAATTFDRVVVFGDSLSDNGNFYEYMNHQMPVSPPYFQGRFTNGPVWIELLLQKYYGNNAPSHLLNYAFGGSGVSAEDGIDDEGLFTLRREVDSYLLAHQDKADSDSLYVMWMGANNYLVLSDDMTPIVHQVNAGIKSTLEYLVSKGARHFLVINLPNLGRAPAARDFDAVDLLEDTSIQHNALLKANVDELQRAYPQVEWIFFDVFQMLSRILDNPARYGFNNTTDTCYEALVDNNSSAEPILNMVAKIRVPLAKDACDGFLFFDPVHPSEPAHVIMADLLYKKFQELKLNFGSD